MTTSQLLALLPILCTSITVIWVMTSIAIKRHHTLNATFAVIGLNLALLSCGVSYSVSPQLVTPLLIVDGYACFYMALVLVVSLATATLLRAYIEKYAGNKEEVYLLLSLSTLGALVVVCSRHFASFFVGLELMSVPLYGLVGYLVQERRSLEASMKYLVLSAIASAFILFGMALIYSQLGALGFADIGARFVGQTGNTLNVIIVAGALLIVGIGFKLSLAPFHLWTPDVYEGAPAPVASYLATASKVAVFAVLLRYFVEAKAYTYPHLLDALTIIAIISIVLGNVLALLQDNIKRLLAYSSISHFGYLLVAFIAGGNLAIEAVGIYLLTYVVTTVAAFGVVTLMSSPYGNHDADTLWDYRGLFWRRPYLTAILTTAFLSLAGIPLTAGFIGKFYAVEAGVGQRLWLLLAFVVLGSAIGLYYYLRAMVQLYLRAPWVRRYSAPLDWAQGTGGAMVIALMVLMLVLGIYPTPFIAIVRAAGLQ